jgi:hypothetical protein
MGYPDEQSGTNITLYTDDKQVRQGKIAMMQAMIFSIDDDCDVGLDSESPVSPA